MYLIRRAEEKDIDRCIILLKQICNVHAKIRSDLFKEGMLKYDKDDLLKIFNNDNTPVFVYIEDDLVLGYCFTQKIIYNSIVNPKEIKTLYIDDLCVDEAYRGKHIGERLFNYVIDYARDKNFYNVTLHVWEGNSGAIEFYKKMGMHTRFYGLEKIL